MGIKHVDVVSAEDGSDDISEGAGGVVDLGLVMFEADSEASSTGPGTFPIGASFPAAALPQVILPVAVVKGF